MKMVAFCTHHPKSARFRSVDKGTWVHHGSARACWKSMSCQSSSPSLSPSALSRPRRSSTSSRRRHNSSMKVDASGHASSSARVSGESRQTRKARADTTPCSRRRVNSARSMPAQPTRCDVWAGGKGPSVRVEHVMEHNAAAHERHRSTFGLVRFVHSLTLTRARDAPCSLHLQV